MKNCFQFLKKYFKKDISSSELLTTDQEFKTTLNKDTPHKSKNKAIGANGERIAKEFLEQNGYKILETNKRFSRFCEIDIIALDKDTLVFIEVKTRSTDFSGSGFEAITKTKYENIKTGLFTYLQEQKNKYKKFRIDAVSIVLKPEIKISHLKNI